MAHIGKLSPIQMELLRIYSFDPSDKELRDVRTMLGKYFGKRLTERAGKAASEKGITEADLDAWLKDDGQ